MRNYIGKNSSKIVFIGFLLICLLSLPASAANVLDIQVTESIDLTKEYNGTTMTTQSSTGTGTITITNNASEDLYDIYLNFDTGSTNSATWQTTDLNVNLDPHTSYVIATINPLEASESVTITYSCSGSEPVSFEESYEQSRILVGDSTNVTLTLTNNASSLITGIELVKTPSDINEDSTPDFMFSDAASSVGTVEVAGGTITWNEFNLISDSNATLTFKASENDPGAHTNTESLSAIEHYMGNATLQFTINNGSESGCGVTLNEDPTAIASDSNFEITLVKNQLDQSEGGDGDDWGFTPTVAKTESDGINYTISAVNLYVTSTSDLQTHVDYETYTDPTLENGTWTGTEWKIYNFPSLVPVGWINVDLSIDLSDSGNQITKRYSNTSGVYKLVEKIYIINGYLVEAKKSIAKNETNENQYDITLWVHNKGNIVTPSNVYVYDIVPNEFSTEYIDTTPDGNTGVTNPITGTAYWWNVGPLEPDGQDGDEVTIHYTVEGSGNYRMTELFILGIDPSYSLNMQSTPILKTGGLAVSNSGAEVAMSILMIASLLLGMVGLSKKRRDK